MVDVVADHPQVAIPCGELTIDVDEGIAPLVQALWRAGIHTVYSCQGEGGVKPENLAYVAFADRSDRRRFAERIPPGRPGWLWSVDHESPAVYDAVHFPSSEIGWLVALFGA